MYRRIGLGEIKMSKSYEGVPLLENQKPHEAYSREGYGFAKHIMDRRGANTFLIETVSSIVTFK